MAYLNRIKPSQKDLLLKLLRGGERVTRLKAMHYGIQNLTARVSELREDGHNVSCVMREDAFGRKYGEFSLDDRSAPAFPLTPGMNTGAVATL